MAMIVGTDETANEIINFLRTKLEIPADVIGVTLRMRVGELVEIDCQYLPRKIEIGVE